MPSNHLILCCPLLLWPSSFPSIRVFSNESVLCIRWPKYLSFSFSLSPSSEYSGLISFRMEWLDFLAVEGDPPRSSPTPWFKSINSLVLIFLYSPPLTSIHDYCRKHGFDRMDLYWQSNVSVFNMLSRLVITFLLRSKCLISWLQSPSAVILEPPKIKSVTDSTDYPSICLEVIGPDAMILVF